MKKPTLLAALFLLLWCTSIQSQSLKFMSYNIRLDVASDKDNAWPLRKDYFTAQIQFYAPDIFGIQEGLPHQVVDIAKALPQYAYVGVGRDENGKGESSNIYYDKERFRLKEDHTMWLSETPDKVSKGWDAALNRVCTYALFKDKKSKKTFWVFNTHLDHMGEVARTKSLELIVSRIKAVNTKNYPVVFMGDFNSEPTTERVINLKKEMVDTRDISLEKPFGPSGTFNGFKFHEPVKLLIDYIFVSKSPKITVKKHAVLSDSKDLHYPSDHLPVYVELTFK
ncbi:MAG: endonuclease/exonuclease/phosphatase family protein [Saprospiraceae bacterium]|nr:endonuclease/exonuclease/phosphatase family protein [Saprospiraceae bacterium]